MKNQKNIRSVIFLFGVGFIIFLLLSSKEILKNTMEEANLFIFTASVFLALLSNLFLIVLYSIILEKYGAKENYSLVCRIFFYSQIAKYIPGKVWSLWYQATHIDSRHAVATVLFSNLDLTFILIVLISGISVGFLFADFNLLIASLAFVFALLTCVALVRSCRFFSVANFFTKRFKRLRENSCDCKTNRSLFVIICVLFLFSASYSASYLLMLYAVFGFDLSRSFNYFGYLGLAWIVGVLAAISPGGMGVRELFFVFLGYQMTSNVSLELLSAIAVVARLWLIVMEISGVLFFIFFTYLINLIREKL